VHRAEKHITFRTPVSIHGSTTSIRTRNDCPGSSEILSPFNDCGDPRDAFFLEWLFLAGTFWNLRRTVLKSYILPLIYLYFVISDWSSVSKESNYFRCWAPSVKAFDNRGSSIILSFNIAAVLTIWQYTVYIRLSRTSTTSGGGTI